ncbi:MAG: CRISPR-associated endonuclease Cas2 [Candidatus Doudnabacteria bacterium]|nr:CRISPR-associated endonuclease Cas2 [Candidatus Doudnabacteria bacterium]
MKESQKFLALQILKLIGVGALFTAATVLSPTFLYQVLKQYLQYKFKKPYNREQIRKAVDYLKRKKFIAYPANAKNSYFYLTKAGRRRLLQLKIQELSIEKVAWDKRWRLVTFDIPETDTRQRFQFRRKLKELGFFHFQRSVFILPYPCEKQINLISEHLNIQPYVHVLTTERFTADKDLVKHFMLK